MTEPDVREGAATSRSPGPRARAALLIAVAALAAGALAASVELTRVHYLTHTDPSYRSVCAINEKVNCETVAQSPWSVLLGLPVSVWSLVAFGCLLALALWGLHRRRLHSAWPDGILLLAALFATGVSTAMAYISYFRIDALCIYCMTLYGISLLLIPVAIGLLVADRLRPLRALLLDLRSLLSSPGWAAVPVALVSLAVAVLLGSVPPYWHHPGWDDLPDLPSGEQAGGGHWIGAEDPLVIVVEFSDYECPFCRRAHRNMRTMSAEYPGEVRLVHRQLALDQACNDALENPYHTRACEFARAAECAGEQGLFWEMNDALFSVQNWVRADDVDLELLAGQVGADFGELAACMRSRRSRRAVRRDIAAAHRKDVRGTPTFFIHAQPYPGGFPPGILRRAVEQARRRAGGNAEPRSDGGS